MKPNTTLASGLAPLFIALAAAAHAADGAAGAQAQAAASAPSADASPAGKIEVLIASHREKLDAFSQKLREASAEERQGIYRDHYPDPAETAAALTALVREHPAEPAAIDAANWLVRNARGDLDPAVFAALAEHHMASPQLTEFAGSLMRVASPEARAFLRKVAAEAPADETKAVALFALASALERDPSAADEYTALLEQIVAEFPDVEVRGRRVADFAEGKLFAARNLRIGKEAPEIVGADVDGNPMKLSDYRGRVVVIDFWGDW